MSGTRLLEDIRSALELAAGSDFISGAEELFGALGYRSTRILEGQSGSVDDFITYFEAANKGTQSEQAFCTEAETVRILFQVTASEIAVETQQVDLFETYEFDKGNAQSFMFAAVELADKNYARGRYVQFTREVNKRLSMPTVVLFRTAAGLLTLAFVYRREHKIDKKRDVLGSVSLIREIEPTNPHRAHLSILADVALDCRIEWMRDHGRSRNFDGLLAAWLAALDTQELNESFYRELFQWYVNAVDTARFPSDQRVTVPAQEHVIRLITRLLFVWFIKEKGLVAEDLFVENKVRRLLKSYDRINGDSYYRAVLQNLFFATLNTEIDRRQFSRRTRETHRNSNLYRFKNEMEDPEALRELFDQSPFVNGGLFECLDSEEGVLDGGSRIDCFSDNPRHRDLLSIPNRLFFGNDGLIDVLEKYKFTVEENTPIEQEVALDPELLGKVFENLLATYTPETSDTARKHTGSYYTPREVVDYMVDEVLVHSLSQVTRPSDVDATIWRDRLQYLFDYQDAFNDAHALFDSRETTRLVDAIAHLSVLDPAVGSGAFPMGVLHKLTLALSRLDPDNDRWLRVQKEIAIREARRAFDSRDRQIRDRRLHEISSTFERHGQSDFGRKLYLIQNAIFGIDVQPMACQIAKLRFFISLVIEQTPTENRADNYGIRPLPNLETRFVCANALIPLRFGTAVLMSDEGRECLQAIKENRSRHFHASGRGQKLKFRRIDRRLRGDLAEYLRASGMPESEASLVSSWDPYDQSGQRAMVRRSVYAECRRHFRHRNC